MKIRLPVKLLAVALLSSALGIGCSAQQPKESTAKASPEATAAIAAASAAIKAAKANDWLWRDTEKFLKEAQEAADKGDTATAVKKANKAKFQAEAAIIQYNHEKSTSRGL
jgi:flagellar basal body L-ring protein FlgH